MQKLVKRFRIYAAHSLTLCDQPLISHFNGNPERRLSCTFAASGLQHIKLMLFDCKFQILHIPIMAFKLFADRIQLGKHLWHFFF